MLDAKIMAAVLTALTAVAVTTGGGTVDKSEFEKPSIDSLKELGSSDILTKIKDIVQDRPDPENNIEANLTIGDLNEKKLKISNANINASDMYEISFENKNISSDKIITLKKAEGTIDPGEKSALSLNAGKILTSGVKISGKSSINEEIDSKTIEIKGVNKIDLKYSEARGAIKTNSTTSEIDSNQKIDIKSFSGDLKIEPRKDKLHLDGKFYSLNSGELQFGG